MLTNPKATICVTPHFRTSDARVPQAFTSRSSLLIVVGFALAGCAHADTVAAESMQATIPRYICALQTAAANSKLSAKPGAAGGSPVSKITIEFDTAIATETDGGLTAFKILTVSEKLSATHTSKVTVEMNKLPDESACSDLHSQYQTHYVLEKDAQKIVDTKREPPLSECMAAEGAGTPARAPVSGQCTGTRKGDGSLDNSSDANAICDASTSTLFYWDTAPNAKQLYWHVCTASGRVHCMCDGHRI